MNMPKTVERQTVGLLVARRRVDLAQHLLVMGRPEHIEARIGARRHDRRIGRQAIARLGGSWPGHCRARLRSSAPWRRRRIPEFRRARRRRPASPASCIWLKPMRRAASARPFSSLSFLVSSSSGSRSRRARPVRPSACRTIGLAWTKPDRWSQCSWVAIRRSISPPVTSTMLSITCFMIVPGSDVPRTTPQSIMT